jgi:uncharacterized OsmC-like protein
MGRILEVECKHLEDELMRVRFASSQLVADHPFRMGGTETGPSPGEMMMMGLASASALAGRRFAQANELAVGHVGARASISMTSEGFAGPLHNGPLLRRTYVGQFWRRLEAEGALSDSDRDSLLTAMSDTTVARTLMDGAAIDERLVAHRNPAGRPAPKPKNPFYLTGESTERMPEGERVNNYSATTWRVSAAALDEDTCLLKAVRSLWVVGRAVEQLKGPTPEELLLAALAACTTIYVARNANLQDIPLDVVHVKVRAEIPEDAGAPIVRFEKSCEVVGDLTAKEIADLEHMAYYCALGETIKRGTPFTDEVAVLDHTDAAGPPSALGALDAPAPQPSDPQFCDDGACCLGS